MFKILLAYITFNIIFCSSFVLINYISHDVIIDNNIKNHRSKTKNILEVVNI